jgi:uncharacterized protein (UPF0548 family)
MSQFRKPTPESIHAFLEFQRPLNFTYRDAGSKALSGYSRDHTRVQLGEGIEVFEAAKAALRSWQHFRLGWIEAWPCDTPIQKDEVVAVLAHQMGLWWLNACRIINVIDEEEPKRFGFVYGTLPGHVESGKERFLIEMNQGENVWYDILAFSRPRHILARLGYRYVRRLQKQFAKQSAAAMCRAVRSELDSLTEKNS